MIPVFAPALFMPEVAAASTTFDPANTGAGITLSNGNLTATKNGSATNYNVTRSISSHSTGQFYCEFTIGSTWDVGNDSVGVCDGSHPISNNSNGWLGADIHSTGFFNVSNATPTSGQVFQNGAGLPVIQGYIPGYIIGMAVDVGAALIWFASNGGNWNNSGTANPATGIGGLSLSETPPFFAAINLYTQNSDFVTANFGGSAYSFTPPAGFGNW